MRAALATAVERRLPAVARPGFQFQTDCNKSTDIVINAYVHIFMRALN